MKLKQALTRISIISLKIILSGYAIDLLFFQGESLGTIWMLIMGLMLTDGIARSLYEILAVHKLKLELAFAVIISSIIGFYIKLFTFGNPIFDAVQMLINNHFLSVLLIVSVISAFLLENALLRLTKSTKSKPKLYNREMPMDSLEELILEKHKEKEIIEINRFF